MWLSRVNRNEIRRKIKSSLLENRSHIHAHTHTHFSFWKIIFNANASLPKLDLFLVKRIARGSLYAILNEPGGHM